MHITAQDTTGRAIRYAHAEATLKEGHVQDVVARPFTVGGIEGREFTYKRFRPTTGQLEPTYMRTLVLDSVSYALLFLPNRQADILRFTNEGQQRRFFNSTTVKP